MEKENLNCKRTNTKVIAAALIALGIFAAGLALRNGIVKFKSMERIVTVKGLAEKEVPADKVVWRINYSEMGNDILSLYATVEKNNAAIKSYLIENGLDESEIFISSPSLTDQEEAYSYRENKPRFKYSIYSSITIPSKKIDIVRGLTSRIVTDFMKKGVVLNDYAYYDFTGLNEIKPQMIEDATANARASAQKFAEDSHSRIGKIKTASQGQFSIDDLDETTPYIKKVRVVTTIVYYLN